MHNRSKSTLFLMELLIAILVFALCAAVCVKTFVTSHMMVLESKDRNNALIIAENCAEVHKALRGELEEASTVLGGRVSENGNTLVVYYDKKWQVCEEKDSAYTLSLTNRNEAALVLGDISVLEASGREILSFTAAARRSSYE